MNQLIERCIAQPHYRAALIYPTLEKAIEGLRRVDAEHTGLLIRPSALTAEFPNGSVLRLIAVPTTGEVYALAGLEFDEIDFPDWEPELAVLNFARSRVRATLKKAIATVGASQARAVELEEFL